MELKLIKALWGMDGSLESQMSRIHQAGYVGIEAPLPTAADEGQFKELLQKYNLDYIAMVFTGGDHVASFAEQVRRAAEFQPLLINSHSAKDSMPYDEQLRFFEAAIAVERSIGIPIGHETHRGRATFTPWTTAQLLRDLPDIHLVADFSHWVNVCESMLPDQDDNIALAIQHAIHIHGRVGYEQGPQVTDFRAPEFEYTLTRHEGWWDAICANLRKAGLPYVTFTPEFGPPGYMHTLPYTKQPVTDLWDVCYAMAERFRRRYQAQ